MGFLIVLGWVVFPIWEINMAKYVSESSKMLECYQEIVISDLINLSTFIHT